MSMYKSFQESNQSRDLSCTGTNNRKQESIEEEKKEVIN